MTPVPTSHEYLFEKYKLTQKNEPTIKPPDFSGYADNINRRNKKRETKKLKG